MNVNVSKTKYTLISAVERRINLYNLCLEGISFYGDNKFRYLDNMVDNEKSINTTIYDRIQIGHRAYYANNRLLRNKLISCNSKMKIFK